MNGSLKSRLNGRLGTAPFLVACGYRRTLLGISRIRRQYLLGGRYTNHNFDTASPKKRLSAIPAFSSPILRAIRTQTHVLYVLLPPYLQFEIHEVEYTHIMRSLGAETISLLRYAPLVNSR